MHKLLDAGAWTLTDDRRILVSKEFTGSDRALSTLRDLHGKPLRTPWFVSLEELDEEPLDQNSADSNERAADEAHNVARLHELIRQLVPPDSQVMMLYLEDMDAVSIGEITGLSARAVATRVHRIKAILARQFRGAFRE